LSPHFHIRLCSTCTSACGAWRRAISTACSSRPWNSCCMAFVPRHAEWHAGNFPMVNRVLFVTLLGTTVLIEACKGTTAATPPPAPPDVSVITVSPERVALTSEWIATLDGYVNAQI